MSDDDFEMTTPPQVIIRSEQDPAVRVRLHDRQFDEYETAFAVELDADGLTAHLRDVVMVVGDTQDLSDFMDDLAADFRGWSDERSWSTNHLKLTAVFHSGGHIELRWTLRPRVWRQDTWEASITTWVEGGQQLTDLAADVRAFLTRPQPV